MTYAPQPLLTARAVLVDELDVHPGVAVASDLEAAEVGIVGDDGHDGGYHCGWDRRRIRSGVLADYSWQESPRDWNHKSDASRGLDVGWFSVVLGGRTVTLYDYNRWLVGQCRAGAPDTLDIREVIYTLDGRTVQRWDRLGRRTSGDSSHLTHTHESFFADAEHRDKASLIRRFITEMKGGADLDANQSQQLANLHDIVIKLANGATGNLHAHVPNSPVNAWLKAAAEAQSAAVAVSDAQLAVIADRLEVVLAARVDAAIARIDSAVEGAIERTRLVVDPPAGG